MNERQRAGDAGSRRLSVEEKMYQTNPYQPPCQGPAFLWCRASAGRMWNLEHPLEPGTVASFFLQTTLSVWPGSSDRKSQAVPGEGSQASQKEAKRNFLGTQAWAGGYACTPRISIKLAHGGLQLWGGLTLTKPSEKIRVWTQAASLLIY